MGSPNVPVGERARLAEQLVWRVVWRLLPDGLRGGVPAWERAAPQVVRLAGRQQRRA